MPAICGPCADKLAGDGGYHCGNCYCCKIDPEEGDRMSCAGSSSGSRALSAVLVLLPSTMKVESTAGTACAVAERARRIHSSPRCSPTYVCTPCSRGIHCGHCGCCPGNGDDDNGNGRVLCKTWYPRAQTTCSYCIRANAGLPGGYHCGDCSCCMNGDHNGS